MTEKEKMLSGEYYNSRDPELIGMYHRARKLLKDYNNLDSDLIMERERILNDLFGHKGTGVWIETPFFVIMERTFRSEKTPSLIPIVCFWTIIRYPLGKMDS
jgi:hypothetical protein